MDPQGAAIGLDLGFLPTKLSLDFIREIPGREFSSQALCQEGGRKIGNNGMLESLEPPPEKPGIFSAGFPFPNGFSRQIPLFFSCPSGKSTEQQIPRKEPFFPMKNPWEAGFPKKLESHNFKENKKKIEGWEFFLPKIPGFFLFSASSRQINGSYI